MSRHWAKAGDIATFYFGSSKSIQGVIMTTPAPGNNVWVVKSLKGDNCFYVQHYEFMTFKKVGDDD